MPSPVQPIERKLAAIFAADVAGYSRLMGQDEVGTLRTLAAHREIMDRLIAEHRGRIANTAGDSVLAEFPSVVDAVQCAVEVQQALTEANEGVPEDRRMSFRIGVHVGDVMVRGADLLGDGVNVAARLQALADPGGVCLSGEAHQYARKALPLTYADLGHQTVRNIEEPVRAYKLVAHAWPRGATPQARSETQPRLPDKPSIAVLPFTNMSGDAEQEYFADGMVEEIITALSRFRQLFVIARNSSFTYKGRAVDVKQVGRELGVRYVLEGSVRKAGDRLRITGQLIDALKGAHLWADRFDGGLTDLFRLQDEITERVVTAIEPSIRAREIERARSQSTNDLNAYDLYLRALPECYSFTEQGFQNARTLLRRAVEIDPGFSDAWALLADCVSRLYNGGWLSNLDEAARECCEAASRAIDADPENAVALATGAWCFAMFSGEHDQAAELAHRAVRQNPNSFYVQSSAGWALVFSGELERAITYFDEALRISPVDVERHRPYVGKAAALLFLRRFPEAELLARRALLHKPNHPAALRLLATALALAERKDEAAAVARTLRSVHPQASISVLKRNAGRYFRYKWMLDMYEGGLRKAGLPE